MRSSRLRAKPGAGSKSADCDPLNAVFYDAAGFKDKSVLVGALDQAGGSIASYSNRADN